MRTALAAAPQCPPPSADPPVRARVHHRSAAPRTRALLFLFFTPIAFGVGLTLESSSARGSLRPLSQDGAPQPPVWEDELGAAAEDPSRPSAQLEERGYQHADSARLRSAALELQDGNGNTSIGVTAAPVLERILDSRPVGGDPSLVVPVFIGSGDPKRWKQIMDSGWIRPLVEETASVLYRVNCTLEKDEIQGVIDCHSLVAKAALEYWKGQPGTYIDMEDNCKPSQRANFGYILEASARLKSRRDWSFIHLSRFPAPFGIFNPQTCAETPFNEAGGHVYRKLYGLNELAQAMLDHTDFASRITAPSFRWTKPYDEQFGAEMLYVVYPAVFQRQTESATPTHATEIFHKGIGKGIRDAFFTPWVYSTFDYINARFVWVLFFVIPFVTLWCLTNDHVLAAWGFAIGFLVCWGLGFR